MLGLLSEEKRWTRSELYGARRELNISKTIRYEGGSIMGI